MTDVLCMVIGGYLYTYMMLDYNTSENVKTARSKTTKFNYILCGYMPAVACMVFLVQTFQCEHHVNFPNLICTA